MFAKVVSSIPRIQIVRIPKDLCVGNTPCLLGPLLKLKVLNFSYNKATTNSKPTDNEGGL